MILYHTADLMFATKIRSTADALELDASPVKDLEAFNKKAGAGGVRGLLVDLDSEVVGLSILQAAAAEIPAARKIAFGPHVNADLLERAATMGADEVMPRSKFANELPQILKSFASGG
ncbi:MAG: hypothetical protein ACF8PN_08395 [Phycisphaerales bacterium]